MFSMRTFGLLFSLTLLLSACQPINLGNIALPAPTTASEATLPASVAESEATLPDLGTLQIAYVPVLAFTPLFVAAEKGYFAEQGLQVELQRVRNVDEMLAPLSTGQLDISLTGATTGFFNAMQQALDFRIVAGGNAAVNTSKGDPVLVVSKALMDSGAVSTVADLKGRKLAINLRGSALEYLLSKALEQAGLTLDDVELVTIPGGEMLAALANGAVDGAIAGGLNTQRMINEGVAVKLLADNEIIQSGQGGVVVVGQRLLQPANREVTIRILVAFLQAVRDLNENGWDNPEIIGIIQKYTEMEPALIARSAFPLFESNGALDEASIMDVQAFQISRGYVEYTEALPVAQMTDLTFLSEALARIEQK